MLNASQKSAKNTLRFLIVTFLPPMSESIPINQPGKTPMSIFIHPTYSICLSLQSENYHQDLYRWRNVSNRLTDHAHKTWILHFVLNIMGELGAGWQVERPRCDLSPRRKCDFNCPAYFGKDTESDLHCISPRAGCSDFNKHDKKENRSARGTITSSNLLCYGW